MDLLSSSPFLKDQIHRLGAKTRHILQEAFIASVAWRHKAIEFSNATVHRRGHVRALHLNDAQTHGDSAPDVAYATDRCTVGRGRVRLAQQIALCSFLAEYGKIWRNSEVSLIALMLTEVISAHTTACRLQCVEGEAKAGLLWDRKMLETAEADMDGSTPKRLGADKVKRTKHAMNTERPEQLKEAEKEQLMKEADTELQNLKHAQEEEKEKREEARRADKHKWFLDRDAIRRSIEQEQREEREQEEQRRRRERSERKQQEDAERKRLMDELNAKARSESAVHVESKAGAERLEKQRAEQHARERLKAEHEEHERTLAEERQQKAREQAELEREQAERQKQEHATALRLERERRRAQQVKAQEEERAFQEANRKRREEREAKKAREGQTSDSGTSGHHARRSRPGPPNPSNNRTTSVTVQWARYQARWEALPTLDLGTEWTFATIPWPIAKTAYTLIDLTDNAMRLFFLVGGQADGTSRKDRVRANLLRWHPDKFIGKYLDRVRAADKVVVVEGVNTVTRLLQTL